MQWSHFCAKNNKVTKRSGGCAYQFKNNEEQVIDDERPFAAISITSNSKRNRTNGSEHENKGNAPGDVGCRFVKVLGEVTDGQGNCEEVEGVPGLSHRESSAIILT